MASTAAQSIRPILNAALGLTALGMVVRASGAVKEIIFAQAFGISAETDSFVLAVTYSTVLPSVVGGAFATTLIAHLANAQAHSYSGLAYLARWIAATAVGCALLMHALAPFVVPRLFSVPPEDLGRTVEYCRMLAPLGFTMMMSISMDGILNSAKQFYVPAINALATPVTIMAAILLFSDTGGVKAAAWGMVAGGAIEVSVLALRIGAQRSLFLASGNEDPALLGKIWKSVAILSCAAAIAAVTPVIDQIFVSKLETGAVTSLNYASKVNSLLIGVFGAAVSVAIYPYLSDLAAQRDSRRLKRLSWNLAAVMLPVTGLATVLVFVFSYDIVRLLFARGNFTETAVVQVAAIQQIYSFQLVFYVGGLLAMRVLNALSATRAVLTISCLTLVTTAFFDWLLYQRMGASGIALAAVLTSAAGLGWALLFVRVAMAPARR